jgi:hypothetical protein
MELDFEDYLVVSSSAWWQVGSWWSWSWLSISLLFLLSTMIALQEEQSWFLWSTWLFSSVDNVDFIGVLGWLNVDDGLWSRSTSSVDNNFVFVVVGWWLDKDDLFASLGAWKVHSVLEIFSDIISSDFAVNGDSSIVASLRSGSTESLPKSKSFSLNLRGDDSDSSIS